MEYDKKIFQRNVRYIREGKNLSQERFGELIGVVQKTVSTYETGDNPNPTLDNLISIAKVGNTSVEALLSLNLKDDVFNFGTRKPDAGDFEFSHFEGMTYHVYYLSESEKDPFYHGYISFDRKYDKEHLFLHGTATTGHTYDCKLVIEGTHTFYIYGTEIDLPRRMHIGLYYPDFRDEVKYHAGLGLLTRIDSRKFFSGMKVAVTDIEIEVDDPVNSSKLKEILSECADQDRVIINRQMDVEFRKWVAIL